MIIFGIQVVIAVSDVLGVDAILFANSPHSCVGLKPLAIAAFQQRQDLARAVSRNK